MMRFLCAFLLLFAISCSKKPEKSEPAQTIKSDSEVQPVVSADETKSPTISDSLYESEISVSGVRKINSVTDEVKRHLISINYWYNRDFKTPTEQEVLVKFFINELGVAHSPKLIQTTLKDTAFVNRILNDIPRWRFARFNDGSGETEVIYPIKLTPAKKLEL